MQTCKFGCRGHFNKNFEKLAPLALSSMKCSEREVWRFPNNYTFPPNKMPYGTYEYMINGIWNIFSIST